MRQQLTRAHALIPRFAETNLGNSGLSRGMLSLLGVTIIAAIIRCAGIHSQSFWYDEVVTRELSFHSFHDLLSGAVRDQGNPPLYWILMKAWSLAFGSGETAFRSFSVLAGAACTALVYQIGKEIFDERVAVFASIAYALSPFSLELSTEARCYAWLQLLAAASFYCFFRFWIRSRAIWLSGVFVFTVLLVFTHYYGFFVPLAQMIILLAFHQYRKLLAWLGAMVPAACIFALGWFHVFLAQVRTPGNGTRGGSVQFFSSPLVFGIGRSLVWKGTIPLAGLAAVSLLALAVFWLPIVRFGCDTSRDSRVRFALLTWLALPVIVPLIVALFGHMLYQTRYATVALPAFALAFGAGVAHLTSRQKTWTLAAALVLVAASLVGFYRHPVKPDWDRAAMYLAPVLRTDDVVFVDSDEEVRTVAYHLQKNGLPETAEVGIMQPGRPLIGTPWIGGRKFASAPQDVSTEIRNHARLWLVIAGTTYGDSTDLSAFRSIGCSASDSRHFYRIDIYELRCAAP